MKSRLLHPGALFVTALVILVLAIPFAQVQIPKPRGEALRQAFAMRAG